MSAWITTIILMSVSLLDIGPFSVVGHGGEASRGADARDPGIRRMEP